MSARRIPPVEQLLEHRNQGMTDADIAKLYGVGRSNISRTFRAHGHGRGKTADRQIPDPETLYNECARDGHRAVAERYGVTLSTVRNGVYKARRAGTLPPPPPSTAAKLPPATDIAELIARGDTHRQIAARYGVARATVAKAIERGRKRGDIPPAPPREPRPPKAMPPAKPAPKRYGQEVLDPTPQVVRRRVRNAQTMVEGRDLPQPAADGQPTCGAQQIVGTRVCDLHPHGGRRHVGASERDPRGEFWGAR